MTIEIRGTLEIDQDRGVIYFHDEHGRTAMRICSLPKGIPNPKYEPSYTEPPIDKGLKRAYVKCKVCGKPYFYDYIPYGLSSPIIVSDCGHSIGAFDRNLQTIPRDEWLKLCATEHPNNEIPDGLDITHMHGCNWAAKKSAQELMLELEQNVCDHGNKRDRCPDIKCRQGPNPKRFYWYAIYAPNINEVVGVHQSDINWKPEEGIDGDIMIPISKELHDTFGEDPESKWKTFKQLNELTKGEAQKLLDGVKK
jgi:hypothetical protein